jgi:hypothetical membrane protein
VATKTDGQISSVCGVLAPLFFVLIVVIAGISYPGYSHVRQAISELGGAGAPYPLIQNGNFLVTGVLIIMFARGLHSSLEDTKRSKLGAALVGAFGVMMIVHAFLPCDTGCEFASTVGSTHNITGLLGFLSAIAGVFVLSRQLAPSTSYRTYSVVTAAAGLVSLVLWIALGRVARIRVMDGSLQRVFAGTLLLWIEATAIRQLVQSRHTRDSRDSVEVA